MFIAAGVVFAIGLVLLAICCWGIRKNDLRFGIISKLGITVETVEDVDLVLRAIERTQKLGGVLVKWSVAFLAVAYAMFIIGVIEWGVL